jgi:hypothetical protein
MAVSSHKILLLKVSLSLTTVRRKKLSVRQCRTFTFHILLSHMQLKKKKKNTQITLNIFFIYSDLLAPLKADFEFGVSNPSISLVIVPTVTVLTADGKIRFGVWLLALFCFRSVLLYIYI